MDSLGRVVGFLEGDVDGLALMGEVEDEELGESWLLGGALSSVSLNLFDL